MITSQNLREMLNARPFRPFRICLSDGSQHEVPHQEFGWVAGNRVFIGVPSATNNPEELSVKQLSILHISRIEELAGSKTS